MNREAAGDDGQGGVAEIQDELGVVFGFNRNPFSGNRPFGNGDAHQRCHPAHRAKPTGQAGDVVDRQIKEGAATRQTVIPRSPRRATVTTDAPCRKDRSNITGAQMTRNLLVGWTEEDIRGGQQNARTLLSQRHQRRRICQVKRHWLFDQYMLTDGQRGMGNGAM